MKLSALRDNAESAQAADAIAASQLSAAENAKVQTAGNVATTRQAFAHGLLAAGGRSVDVTTSPPKVYTADPDGAGYSVSPVPSLDADVSDPASPEATPETSPS